MINRLIYRFSTTIKSDLTIWNNNIQLESGKQSLTAYVMNPLLNLNDFENGIMISAGRVGMHLVQTQKKFTRGVPRYHYFLKMNDISQFVDYQLRSATPLSLIFNPVQTNESRNLDIRFVEQNNRTMFTFFDLQNNNVNKVRRLFLEYYEVIMMKQLLRQSQYDISGMDLQYSLKYDKLIDELVQQAQQQQYKQPQQTKQHQEFDHQGFIYESSPI